MTADIAADGAEDVLAPEQDDPGADHAGEEATPDGAEEETSGGDKPSQRRKRPRTPRPVTAMWLRISGVALMVVAILLLGFVFELGVLGHLRYDRDQQTAYADLRNDLFNATGPVGQTDDNGHLYPLGHPMMILEVPSIGLHATVLEGTTAGVLESGPGHVRTSVLPGQVGDSYIYGRKAAYGAPFRNIASLHQGDKITVITGEAENTFRVLDVRHAGSPMPPALGPTQSRMTLVTADGSAFDPTDVVQVDADLTSAVQPGGSLTVTSLPGNEYANAEDTSNWPFLVLWSQALLVAAAVLTWAWIKWGRWQAWVVGLPVLSVFGLLVVDQVALFLPNLM